MKNYACNRNFSFAAIWIKPYYTVNESRSSPTSLALSYSAILYAFLCMYVCVRVRVPVCLCLCILASISYLIRENTFSSEIYDSASFCCFFYFFQLFFFYRFRGIFRVWKIKFPVIREVDHAKSMYSVRYKDDVRYVRPK